ncbi:MAG: Fe3+ ABC transporter permease [Isosphaeraceae bacterium]
MRWVRGAGRAAGAVLWLIVLLPVLALGPAAVFDCGPGGDARLTPFPAALALLDPYTWLCVRNSLGVALVTTLGSAVLGMSGARVAMSFRFWGRPILGALAAALLAVPPAFNAIGFQGWFGGGGVARLPAWPVDPGWLGWFWSAIGPGSALVGLATAASLREVDPVWYEAARLAGARRRDAWRWLVSPVVWPDAARALVAVFTLTLLDPGPALVLGLRRTLGYQIVEAAWAFAEPGQSGRAVVLTLLGVALAWVGRELIRVGSGSPLEGASNPSEPEPRPTPLSTTRGLLLAGLCSVPLVVLWVPALALFTTAFDLPGRSGSSGSLHFFRDLAADPLVRRVLGNSLAIGLAVMGSELILARLAVALISATSGRLAWIVTWPGLVPPLAIGIGALSLPSLLATLAALLDPGGASGGVGLTHGLADALRSVSAWLDPGQTPGVLLVLGVAVARLFITSRSALERRHRLRPELVDAAVVVGATPGQARRKLSGRWFLGVSPAAAVVSLALAMTHPTPALVLAPTAETRPLGPAILLLARSEDRGLVHASALASVAVAINLAALAAALPGRRGLVRSWLRLGDLDHR